MKECCCYVLLFTYLTVALTSVIVPSTSALSPRNETILKNSKTKNDPIKKVHVVFMNHLDVGYSDDTTKGVGFAIDVINRYFIEYFPRAVKIAHQLKAEGYEETFVYTTHPWLVSLYVDCPDIFIIGKALKCPSLNEINMFTSAIMNGTVAWHAGPMNMQTDNMGSLLFDFGLEIGKSLDRMFAINRTHATYSQRDVPGLTKATIPILLARNVKAISVGVNPGTAPPAVPSPFVWKFKDTDSQGILAFWTKGGYPLNPGPNPSEPGGLARDKCVMADGLGEALCFAFRTDNTGPPTTVQEILSNYEILRAEFPDAEIFASTFDKFVAALDKVRSSLPVRSFEIGDTWIQGIASDPLKISMYRAFMRCLEKCFRQGGICSFEDSRIFNALRFLIKIPEHTWGAHNFLNSIDWTNHQLERARKERSFKETELTWHEQRQFIYLALKALGSHPVSEEVVRALNDLHVTTPDFTGYFPSSLSEEHVCPDGKVIQFGTDGSLVRLYDPFNQIEWASNTSAIAQMTYNTYTEEDFDDMGKLYNYRAGVGFDKPNVTANAHPERKQWEMGVIRLYKKEDDPCDLWLELKLLDINVKAKYGSPDSVFLHYQSVPQTGFNVTVIVANKTTTRLPESLSLNFHPNQQLLANHSWRLEKMNGAMIDPCKVVLNGSQYVHAVSSSVTLRHQMTTRGLTLTALDSPLVLLGTSVQSPSPFPVPLDPIPCQLITSVAFNLHNNIWNTNYMFWYPYSPYDASFMSRFHIAFN